MPAEPTYLGIEGGATKTIALLAAEDGSELGRVVSGPCNLKLLTDSELTTRFAEIYVHFARPSAIGIGMAGAWSEKDHARIRSAASLIWPGVPCYATQDLEPALAAAADESREPASARVLVLSGTGSCCYGQDAAGRNAKVGGWGHLLGDQGSGYNIALKALQSIASAYDQQNSGRRGSRPHQVGTWPKLGRGVMRELELATSEDLIDWIHSATKAEVAALAPEVFRAWQARDPIASGIINAAASRLAGDAIACSRKLVNKHKQCLFVLTGGILLGQPRFARLVSQLIRSMRSPSRVLILKKDTVWGTVGLARQAFETKKPKSGISRSVPKPASDFLQVASRRLSPTELSHPRSRNLDRMSVEEMIGLMFTEHNSIPAKLRPHGAAIADLVRLVARALRRGGRVFYVGAGTSGRLGVLDASECPPTFSTDPELVQGIVAGGHEALWKSLEGAEDDAVAGRREVVSRKVGRSDVVIGIAASGTTPFVWGALGAAKRRGAITALICFNPHLSIPTAIKPKVVLAPNLGPEMLTGSTRLKAGTATKLLLNIISTLAMVRLGKVMGNFMIDVAASNTKLRERAVRMVAELTGSERTVAQEALRRERWRVRDAVRRLGRKQGV